MAGPVERIEILTGLGLSTYQARAYEALLRLGPTDAHRLAKASDVPYTRIYQVCRDLHQKGLVTETLDKPRMYRPTPVEDWLAARSRSLEEEATTLRQNLPHLARVFSTRADADGNPEDAAARVWMSLGRRRVVAQLEDLIASAERSLLLRTDARVLQDILPALEAKALSCPAIHVGILLHVNTERFPLAERASRIADVRHSREEHGATYAVADGREAMMVLSSHGQPSEDLGLHTDSPLLARAWDQSIREGFELSHPFNARVRDLDGTRSTVGTQVFHDVDILALMAQAGEETVDLIRVTTPEAALPTLFAIADVMGRDRSEYHVLTRVTPLSLPLFEASELPPNVTIRHVDHVILQTEATYPDGRSITIFWKDPSRHLADTFVLHALPDLAEARIAGFDDAWEHASPIERLLKEHHSEQLTPSRGER